MSLDVVLISEKKEVEYTCGECGNKYFKTEREILFDTNITHNLRKMADQAGIYEACWRPEEIGATKAKNIIELLFKGLELLKSNPEKFKEYDATNGWGTYEQFVPWVESYLKACKENPDAIIEVSC